MKLKDIPFIRLSPNDIPRPYLPVIIINPHAKKGNKDFFSASSKGYGRFIIRKECILSVYAETPSRMIERWLSVGGALLRY